MAVAVGTFRICKVAGFVLSLGCCLICRGIQAQDTKEFYEQNFAMSGGLRITPTPSPPGAGNAPQLRREPNEGVAHDPQGIPSSASADNGKIISLAIVVSGLDPNHVQRVIDATTPLLSRKIPLKNAIIIGKSTDAKRLAQFFQKSGVASSIVDSLPVSIPAKRSPSWIIHFKDEDALLDGYVNIEPYITNENFFSPPDRT